MNSKWVIPFLVILGIVSVVYSLSDKSHYFSDSQCSDCHYDAAGNPLKFIPTIAYTCISCHDHLETKKSHPSDVYPTMKVPLDMPLVDGRLTCITCHYAHPKENMQYVIKKDYYLRRQVQGVFFCIECHPIDKKGHIVLEKVHRGSYSVTDPATRIDRKSLECIECHDAQMKEPVTSLGAGIWKHFNKEFNHGIGSSYQRLSMRYTDKLKPAGSLSSEIELYDGNIGCGTCHNIYSKEKNMLVLPNRNSKLCLMCHIQ